MIYYCINCKEAMESTGFITQVGYHTLFSYLPELQQPLCFCVNEDCPRYGLASIMMSKKKK